MDMHNLLALVIPTNEPYVFANYFMPSLIENMTDIKDFCTIAINFQDPYTNDQVEEYVARIQDAGFKVNYVLNPKYPVEKKGYVPFNRIRNDAVKLVPDAQFYALTDDDFKYLGKSLKSPSAGEQYLRVLHYMLTHPLCGLVSMSGSMYRFIPINHIGMMKTIDNEWYITGKGMIYRRMPDFPLFSDDALDLKGAGEEKLLAAYRLYAGYYPAKMSNSRTQHEEIKSGKKDPNVVDSGVMYGWYEEQIFEENINKYLNEKFNSDIHSMASQRVVKYEDYLRNGGLDLDTHRGEMLKDYTNYSKSDLISEIEYIINKEGDRK